MYCNQCKFRGLMASFFCVWNGAVEKNSFLRPRPGHWRASKESRDSWGAPTVLAIKRVEVNENPGSQSQGEVHRHPYLQGSAWAFFCLHSPNLAAPSLEPGNSRTWKVLPPTPSDVEFKPHSNPRHARSSSPQQFPPAQQYGAQASSVPLGKHTVHHGTLGSSYTAASSPRMFLA